MPSYSGDYETEYDYEAETDYEYCRNSKDKQEYGYGIDTESFHLTYNDAYYGNGKSFGDKDKKVRISKKMSIYIPDLGLTPTYFNQYTQEETNDYFVDYLSRVLCSPYDPIVKKIHKVHAKLNKKTDTISCAVYVEWYNDMKTVVFQKNIKDKTQKVSIKFEIDGFEWKLQKNYKPLGDFNYEEKLRAQLARFEL